MIKDCNTPLITVYIPCRNYGRYLSQALDSLMAQLQPSWEAFVIDEASDDDTFAIASSYSARDSRITVLKNEAPQGLQRVANRVLGLARGRYLIRLDADDWLDEMALLVLEAKLSADPNLGVVYGNYFYTDAHGSVIGMERRHRLGVEDRAGHLAPHGACTMIRTRSLKAVGGYSEDINAQDGWELWYKLIGRVGAASVDLPVFYYRQHGKSLSRDHNRLLSARARIFDRINSGLRGDYTPSCAAVIPVRENYPAFKNVPYREYNGRSLLELAILSAAEAKHVDHVIVSSQSEAVLQFSSELEANGKVPPHVRIHRGDEVPDRAAVPIRRIMLQAVDYLSERNGVRPDIAMFLSIHAVLRRSEHVDKALNILRITESDSVVSVQEEREPLFSHGRDGLELINPGRLQDLAYDRERLYRFNGAVIAVWSDILESSVLLGEKISYIEMSSADSWQIKSASLLEGML